MESNIGGVLIKFSEMLNVNDLGELRNLASTQ